MRERVRSSVDATLSHTYAFWTGTTSTAPCALSLPDALPIWRIREERPAPTNSRVRPAAGAPGPRRPRCSRPPRGPPARSPRWSRSEEHTSELQSREKVVRRHLLEKKKGDTLFLEHPPGQVEG